MTPKTCKMRIHFWNHFLPIRRPSVRYSAGTLSPRNPPLFYLSSMGTGSAINYESLANIYKKFPQTLTEFTYISTVSYTHLTLPTKRIV